jgi:hypothetical protein
MSTAPSLDREYTCDQCRATIYQIQINRGQAGRWAGKLLCPHCLKERKESDPMVGDPELAGSADATGAIGSGLSEIALKRPLNRTGEGATRVRTFHAKLSEVAIRHLDTQVNLWLEQNPEIEIKFANTTVGTWEGKHPEPAMILTVFY